MADWQAFSSSRTTGVSEYDRTFVEPPESIGSPFDSAATEQNSTNAAFSLAKGMLSGLGLSAGSGAIVNTDPHIVVDPLRSLGSMSDSAADDDGSADWSAIALLKGIVAQAGI